MFDSSGQWVYTKTDLGRNYARLVPEVVLSALTGKYSTGEWRVDDAEEFLSATNHYYCFELERIRSAWDDETDVYISADGTFIDRPPDPDISGGEGGKVPVAEDLLTFIEQKYSGAVVVGKEYDDGLLEIKIKHDGLNIPEDVIEFIASTANGSVRELQGVINSLMAYSVVYNCEIDMELAQRIIKRSVKVNEEPLTIDEIIESVCQHYNVTTANVNSRSRKKEYVMARQVSIYLAQKYTKLSASRIGRMVGGRDHATVIYSCNQVEQRLKIDQKFSSEISSIENSFKMKS